MPRAIDEKFLALPSRQLADAALTKARELGAQHASFRVERIRSQQLRLRDASLEGRLDDEEVGGWIRRRDHHPPRDGFSKASRSTCSSSLGMSKGL